MNLMDKAAAHSRIEHTERLIRPFIRHTPVIEISGSDLGVDVARVVLKLEFMQLEPGSSSREIPTRML
jgi:threonine dehydratase